MSMFKYFIGVMFRLTGVDKKLSPSVINFKVGTSASVNVEDDGTGGVDISIPNGITSGNQTISGVKTFSDGIIASTIEASTILANGNIALLDTAQGGTHVARIYAPDSISSDINVSIPIEGDTYELETKANRKTVLSSDSDSYYPTVKAVNTAITASKFNHYTDYDFFDDFDGNNKMQPTYNGSTALGGITFVENRPGIEEGKSGGSLGHYWYWYPSLSGTNPANAGISLNTPSLKFYAGFKQDGLGANRCSIGLARTIGSDGFLTEGVYFQGENSTYTPTLTVSCTTVSGSTAVSSAALFSRSHLGKVITGTGIPANTIVTGYSNTSGITISNAATISGTNTLSFAPSNKWQFLVRNGTNNILYDTGVDITSNWTDFSFIFSADLTTIDLYIDKIFIKTVNFTYRHTTETVKPFMGTIHMSGTGSSGSIFADYARVKCTISR